jgi:heavy metal efflux system protein
MNVDYKNIYPRGFGIIPLSIILKKRDRLSGLFNLTLLRNKLCFNNPKTMFLGFFFMLVLNKNQAQIANSQPITLENAVKIALENNAMLKPQRLKVTQSEQLENTAFDIPKTSFNTELGQINSRAFDSRWSVSQSFSLPKTYRQRAELLKTETELQRRTVAMNEHDLKAQIYTVYYELLYLMEQKALLLRNDSLYLTNLRNAEIRLKTGETGILEKTTAETQRLQIAHQLQLLESDIMYYQIQLKNLLYTEGSNPPQVLGGTRVYIPEKQALKVDFSLPDNADLLKNHPELQFLKQQIEIVKQQALVEKDQLLPSFSVGYSLQSVQGTQTFGTKDYSYNAVPRFSTLQLGTQIPLFKKATQSRIAAAQIGEQVAQSTLQARETAAQNRYRLFAKCALF